MPSRIFTQSTPCWATQQPVNSPALVLLKFLRFISICYENWRRKHHCLINMSSLQHQPSLQVCNSMGNWQCKAVSLLRSLECLHLESGRRIYCTLIEFASKAKGKLYLEMNNLSMNIVRKIADDTVITQNNSASCILFAFVNSKYLFRSIMELKWKGVLENEVYYIIMSFRLPFLFLKNKSRLL
jgi:hypothetical protein